jgi:RNA polymerase sigma factor for flagellar operon FliA
MNMAATAYLESSPEIEEWNELAMRELPQVYYIASRICERLPRQVEMQDLVQAGVIGLLEAARNFTASKDAQFSTFAKYRIRGAILDSLRKLDWGSRALRKRGRAITESVSRLEAQLGREPLEEEIAADMKMSLEELQSTMSQLDGLYLLGQQVESDQDGTGPRDLIESAPSRGGDDPFELYAESEKQQQVAVAVAKLSEREQLLLSLYYREEMNMKEIASILGIAVSRVSQIHAAVMLKLRAPLAHLGDGHNADLPQRAEARRRGL